MATVTTFEETVAALDAIVDDCASRGDRAGYFAAMYGAVTATVRDRAAAGGFTDAARMERFTAGFAMRYLDAYEAWRAGRPCSSCWQVAFDASRRWRPVILQHLLLAINAHINLDLGVVASGLGEGGALTAVRVDFDAVNDVLGELVEGSQAALGEVSPWIGLADRVGGGGDEVLIRFSLVAARRQAWRVAIRLAPLTGDARSSAIADVDAATARVARAVEHPGIPASALLLLVRARERASPAAVMRLLADVRPSPTPRVS